MAVYAVHGESMISVLLPSIRPHLIARTLESLPYGVETVVVADYPTQYPWNQFPEIRWFERERRGVIDAINFAYAQSSGEYLFILNDQSWLKRGALEALLEEALKKQRQIYTPRHEPPFRFVYYDIEFAAFPFIHRSVLEEVGSRTYILDPSYRGFYGDPDLSLRAHAHGIPITVVKKAVLFHCNEHDAPHNDHVSAFLAEDQATFRSRWDHLGAFRDP